MAKKKRALPIRWSQLALVAALALLIAYVVSLFEVAVQGSQAKSRAEEVQAEVDALRAEREELLEYLEFVKSDAYVEMVARQELNLRRPGEKVYKAFPRSAATPTPIPAPTSTPVPTQATSPSLWQQLKERLIQPPATVAP